MKVQASVMCHEGCVRSNNEDNYYLQGQIRQNVEQPRDEAQFDGHDTCALFAVADGMGGQTNGELASLIAVQNLEPCSIEQVREQAVHSIRQANELICGEMIRVGRRMGTTLAALYVDGGRAVVCNVGDSRVYLLRNGELTQLSTDHSQVQQMIELGILTPEDARSHPQRHVLTQHLGIREDEMIIQPAFSESVNLAAEDVFLLCSDGLTDMVDDKEIQHVLSENKPEYQARALVERALAAGGRDNVTVMVVRFSEEVRRAKPRFFSAFF